MCACVRSEREKGERGKREGERERGRERDGSWGGSIFVTSRKGEVADS